MVTPIRQFVSLTSVSPDLFQIFLLIPLNVISFSIRKLNTILIRCLRLNDIDIKPDTNLRKE